MKIASIADVKAHLSAYLRDCERGPVVVTRNGKPVAVLLAVRGEEELDDLIVAHSPRLRAILDSSRNQIRAGQKLNHQKFWSAADKSKQKPDRKKG